MEMMGRCGILCSECPAFLATTSHDDALRKTTAEKWSKMYRSVIEPQQINCLGCRSHFNFAHCNVCEVRACTIEKNLDHCGVCDVFPCSKEKPIFNHVHGVKERLEAFKIK